MESFDVAAVYDRALINSLRNSSDGHRPPLHCGTSTATLSEELLRRRAVFGVSKTAIAGGVAQLLAGHLDEIEDGGKEVRPARQRTAGDHDPKATMAGARVLEGELDFRADGKRPFGDKADSVGSPFDLLAGQLQLIRKIDNNRSRPAAAGVG
jgi:hypothetical protein